MQIIETYEKIKKDFLRQDGIAGIFLIGKGAKVSKEEFDSLNDIDLLVVYDNDHVFMRKVELIEGKMFDISYISMTAIRELIDKKVPRWITIIGNSKSEGIFNTKLEEMIHETIDLYNDGTAKLTKDQIEVERFLISSKFEDILNRKDNEPEAMFLIDLLLKKITLTYFNFKRLWPCPDKKLLSVLKRVDEKAYDYCNKVILERDLDKRIELLREFVLYILEPYGGMCSTIEKREFPVGL